MWLLCELPSTKAGGVKSFRGNSWLSCPATALCNVHLEPAPALQIRVSEAVERHTGEGEAVPKHKTGAGSS